jgi:hemolysin III
LNVSARRLVRRYSRWELRADGAIHIVGVLAGLAGAIAILLVASHGGAVGIAVAGIYSIGLLAMLGCSAAYNCARESRYAPLLRGLDQSAIFLMIAGTYTPFTLLRLGGVWGFVLTGLVWSVAVGGIVLRAAAPKTFERVSLALYLSLGWVGLVAAAPLAEALEAPTLILLAVGGVLYTVGVIFHVWERLPFQNAIWHAFVFAAACVHYAAVAVSL